MTDETPIIRTTVKSKKLPMTLRHLRCLHGFSTKYLATVCGVHPQYYPRYEDGRSAIPYDSLEKLSEAFSVPLNALIYGNIDFNEEANKLEHLKEVKSGMKKVKVNKKKETA